MHRWMWRPLVACLAISSSGAELDKADFFETKIRPLLATRCFACHGQTATAGLGLSVRDSAMRGGRSGPAIVPGKPEESLLLRAVAHTHSTLKMPPNGKLDPQKIADLEQWIRDGAVWPDSPREFFLSKIKPVLDEKCTGCHGPNPQGGLRLDTKAGFAKGGKSGSKGLPELLIQAIRYEHASLKMPPAGKLPAATIADFERWAKQGAEWADAPETLSPYFIRPEQKAFWSFQPVRVTDPPAVAVADWNRNPIDRFVYSALERKSMRPGARAGKLALIRRVTFDLTGLPPSPAEIEAFVGDVAPDAYAQLVDRLLASPHYGERWGRHWLDLARYADTAGDASDFPVPEAYKYRNWVIDAFNRDMPYDRFVRDQIAGDLLPASNDDERWRQTLATGYLAISRRIGVSPHQERHVTIEDTIDNTTRTFLGLSVGCARCHDHKFDPIPTSDYYALYGIFDSSTYPFAGSEHRPQRADFVYRVGAAKAREILRPFEEELVPWNKRERQKFEEYQEFQNRKITTPGRSRQVVWNELLALREERRAVAEKFPKLETAYAIGEGDPHDVPIQKMGEPQSPGPVAPRGFLQILGGQKLSGNEGSGRRQLADWIASAENPLTPRVMVNRIWHYHFGEGLVSTTNDFGVRGAAPTNPALLDYLAGHFVSGGWSVKAMHRLILLSETYRLSSEGMAANIAADPRNQLHWRQNRRRLDAESISDSVRLLSGSLDLTRGEQHPFPNERTYFYRQHEPFSEFYPNRKRTLYGLQQRFQKNGYLDLFDGPDGNLPLSERKSTTTSLQALWLMNSKFLHEESDAIAERLRSSAPAAKARVDWAFRNIFGHPATSADLQQSDEFLARLARDHRTSGCEGALCDQRVWASYIRAMFSSNSFLFVD